MDIHSERRDDQHLVALVGRFDAHEIAGFQARMERLLAEGGSTIRIDLSRVHFIDSSALAELLRVSRAAAEVGVGIVLAEPSDPVRVIFELTALDQAFTIEHASVPDVQGHMSVSDVRGRAA